MIRTNQIQIDLVEQKGFYPYEYMTDFEKLKGKLPKVYKIYSSLINKKINDKEYEHVLNVRKKLGMETVKGYHILYLECDVLLLADVIEKIRNNSLKSYGLCSSHYFSAPVLSWDSMLKMTKIKLELIIQVLKCTYSLKKCVRSGISFITNRYSKANKKYFKSHDQKQESKHNVYLDGDDLYGYAMSEFLPASGFKWIDPKEFGFNEHANNSSKGCVLKVDLEYPKELYELHNDYTLALNKREIKRETLPEYQLQIADL